MLGLEKVPCSAAVVDREYTPKPDSNVSGIQRVDFGSRHYSVPGFHEKLPLLLHAALEELKRLGPVVKVHGTR